ncbi:hypothetical protein CC78DRAFT_579964 [Lojkania enalia]|uniref:Uncharacterized protein n=1 Tax=Lojkania enalia TaxID=147567 RepID=A0A9P4KA91_9PLEO|nr:hypothetical protein CC78DRAFT_579964 [Didymosphaeria enalia]
MPMSHGDAFGRDSRRGLLAEQRRSQRRREGEGEMRQGLTGSRRVRNLAWASQTFKWAANTCHGAAYGANAHFVWTTNAEAAGADAIKEGGNQGRWACCEGASCWVLDERQPEIPRFQTIGHGHGQERIDRPRSVCIPEHPSNRVMRMHLHLHCPSVSVSDFPGLQSTPRLSAGSNKGFTFTLLGPE